MRVECYERDLTNEGYLVSASTEIGEYYDEDADAIKMSIYRGTGKEWRDIAQYVGSFLPLRRPLEVPEFKEIPLKDGKDIFKADFQELSSSELAERDFCEDWFNILRGVRQDWQLSSFRVYTGALVLHFVRLPGDGAIRDGGGSGSLWIKDPAFLRLYFEGPKTQLGFIPSYLVVITRERTRVEENQGFMKREIYFELKDPTKGTGFDEKNQHVLINEAVGI